jgi:mannosyltransferase
MPTYAPTRGSPVRSPQWTAVTARAGRWAFEPRSLAPVLVLLVAGGLFAVQLGHSSLFMDEVYSWRASRGSLGDLADALRYSEVTPPLYYLILHGWTHVTGGDSEALLRLPSVVAGVALVAAVLWLGSLVAGRTAGLIAASLAAVSPLVLLYSQQVRAYVWVMLAVTVAVAAAIRATRDRSRLWLVTAMVATVCALFLHYTALLVVGPLALWLALQSEFEVRWRLGFMAVLLAALAAIAPLAVTQMGQGHHEATESYASLTTLNALRIAGTPFDGRATGGLVLWRELGAVVVIDALALVALGERFRGLRARALIVSCALVPLGVVCLFSALGQPMALTRYTAVAAPFILVAIGMVAAHAARPLTVALLAAALTVSAAGLFAALLPSGQNPDTRGALATVAAHWRGGDAVAGVGLLGFDGALSYYGEKLLPPGAREVPAFRSLDAAVEAPGALDAAETGGRLWLIADPPVGAAQLRDSLGRLDYAATAVQVFEGNAPVQLIRAEGPAGP